MGRECFTSLFYIYVEIYIYIYIYIYVCIYCDLHTMIRFSNVLRLFSCVAMTVILLSVHKSYLYLVLFIFNFGVADRCCDVKITKNVET